MFVCIYAQIFCCCCQCCSFRSSPILSRLWNSSAMKLNYFAIRGRGESIRIALAAAEQEWEGNVAAQRGAIRCISWS